MPHPTLYRYFRDDKSELQLIGTGVGKNSTLLNGADIYFMGDVMVWIEHGNNGMIHIEVIDAIQEINPSLERKQAKHQLDWRVLTKARAD